MIFQSRWEPVLIQWIVIGFEAILEKLIYGQHILFLIVKLLNCYLFTIYYNNAIKCSYEKTTFIKKQGWKTINLFVCKSLLLKDDKHYYAGNIYYLRKA